MAPVSLKDPVLPETVAALPTTNPEIDAGDAQRSLAAEMERNAGVQPAAYSGPAPSGTAAVASQMSAAPPGTDSAMNAQTSGAAAEPALAAAGSAPVMLASADPGLDPGGLALRMRPMAVPAPEGRLGPANGPAARSPELDALMKQYAEHYDVPEELVRKVAKRESTYNPKARNGPYWGLMQISHATARGMGYRGQASGLLDAETNLKYAVRYLRGAYMVARGNLNVADRLYQRGYYYDAKRAGLLEETGLGTDRRRRSRF